MSINQRFFDYLLSLDRTDGVLFSEECCLFLYSSVLAYKPSKLLSIGLGHGDMALTLLLAINSCAAGTITCLLPVAAEVDANPELIAELERDGVTIVRGAPLDTVAGDTSRVKYDLISVDLSKIDTSNDLMGIINQATPLAHIFLYASDGASRQELLYEAAGRFSLSEWHCDVIRRSMKPGDAKGIEMLCLHPLMKGGGNTSLHGNQRKVFERTRVSKKTIYLALPPPANNFGWGLCSKYLRSELKKLHPVDVLEETDTALRQGVLPGKVFHALTGIRFESIYESAIGAQNYAYTFFENELLPESVENAKRYDVVLGGSTWCMERMREKGIHNSGVLIQGIDPRYFHPITTPKSQDKFVLFSGGKFEPRKGQDLVLAAFKALQDKYADMVLVTSWFNLWPQSMDLMADSKLISYERKGEKWSEVMNHLYQLNGLDPKRIYTVDMVPNETQRDLYSKTDLGLFPNRCEGGTNLVLMEYMACAKPVIGAYSTGQTDVLSEETALLLEDIRPHEVRRPDGSLVATWTEPSLEELIAQIEFAYHNRETVAALGQRAGEVMKKMTWTHTAKALLRAMGAMGEYEG